MVILFKKLLLSFSREIDFKKLLIKSLFLALISSLFSCGYFHYLIYIVHPAVGQGRILSPGRLLITQLMLLFFLAWLCSVAGLYFSRRYKLPGLGNAKNLFQDLPRLLIIGIMLVSVSYFFFDRYFYSLSPLCYPRTPIYILSAVLKSAVSEEVILRLCLTTLCVGLIKNKQGGILLAAVIGTSFTLKYFSFIGLQPDYSYIYISSLIITFISNLVIGYIFIRRGLIYTVILRLITGLNYLLILGL